jgi:histone H3/H4
MSLPKRPIEEIFQAHVRPANVRIHGKAGDLVAACANEFLGVLVHKAAGLCADKSKRVAAHHVEAALRELGFQSIAAQLEMEADSEVLELRRDPKIARMKQRKRERRKRVSMDADTVALQAKMFEDAAKRARGSEDGQV